MRRLPGADIDRSSLLLGHSKGLLKERFLSMALTKIWDIHNTGDSDQGGRPENREIFLSLLDPLSLHTSSHSYIEYYLSRQQNQHDLSCLEQRPPPPTTVPTPMMVIRVSHHCREAGDELDWVLDVLLRHLHHRAVLLLEGQQISATLGHPLVHLSTGETNFQRLTHRVCCSACPARPTAEPFLLIRHICVV